MYFVINTDGASRGNPGPASYGFVIKDRKKNLIYKEGKVIGKNTNNVAEYTAVLKALEYIKENFSSHTPLNVEIITDSLLIASQLSGKFKIKHPILKVLFDQIKILEFELGQINYRNVPREQNQEADKMANLALDSQGIPSYKNSR